MRVKKYRATFKTCKDCCFKDGVKCSMRNLIDVEKYRERNKVVEVECYSKVHLDWWKEDNLIEFKHSQRNWQRMHRKEHLENVRKRALEDIIWAEIRRKYDEERCKDERVIQETKKSNWL